MNRRYFLTSGVSGALSAALLCSLPGGTAAAQEKVVVAYSQAELVNDWRITNQRDMEESAKRFGYELISVSADQDSAKQLSDIEKLLAQGPDVLVVSPIESVALAPAVNLANEAGVPMIVIDRTLDAEPGNGQYITQITQSHVITGGLQAERAVELLKAKYGEPRGKVAHVQGMAGASPVIDANAGWDKVMAAYPDIVTVATADAGFTKEGGIRVMEDFLQRFPAGEIDIVRSDYSDMTLGAIDAIKRAGRTELLGHVVGGGGYIDAIKAVVAGEIARETQTPPYFGELTMETVKKILAGETVPARQEVPVKVFDSSTPQVAADYLAQIEAAGLKF